MRDVIYICEICGMRFHSGNFATVELPILTPIGHYTESLEIKRFDICIGCARKLSEAYFNLKDRYKER